MTSAHPGRILAQDVIPPDGAGEMLSALPISQAEIDDLLYGEDRPAEERLARLRELSAQLHEQEPGDFGDDDPGVIAGEIDEAIARLSGDKERDPDLAYDAVEMDDDPLNHRETLSPDSDELEAIEEDDEASLQSTDEPRPDAALDPEEWDDGEGFKPERGVL
ncbi:MAG: hypothetical protein ABL879_01120 [Devosia sp.]